MSNANANLNEFRTAFRHARENVVYAIGRDEFESILTATVRRNATPEEYVAAAEGMTAACDRCQETGRYSWGAVVNGVISHTGDCYRCSGKGYQDQEDMKRNRAYDRFAISRALSA